MQLSTQKITAEQGAMGFRDLLKFYLDEVCSRERWPVGHAYLPEGNVLFPASIWHLDNPKRYELFRQVSNALRFTKGVGLPGRVFAAKEAEWIDEISSETPSYERKNLVRDSGLASVFAYPIRHGKDVVAILEFFSDRPMKINSEILTYFEGVNAELSLAFAAEQI